MKDFPTNDYLATLTDQERIAYLESRVLFLEQALEGQIKITESVVKALDRLTGWSK